MWRHIAHIVGTHVANNYIRGWLFLTPIYDDIIVGAEPIYTNSHDMFQIINKLTPYEWREKFCYEIIEMSFSQKYW